MDATGTGAQLLLQSPKLLAFAPPAGRAGPTNDQADSLSKSAAQFFHSSLLPSSVSGGQAQSEAADPLSSTGHACRTLENAFMDLVKLNRDQTIIIAGAAGASQPALHRQMTRHLIDLTKGSTSKKSRAHSAALKLHLFLSEFLQLSKPAGTASGALSQLGDVMVTYELDNDGALGGFSVQLYGVRVKRLAQNTTGSFAVVFNDIFAKASTSDLAAFGLATAEAPPRDAATRTGSQLGEFDELRKCLKALGIATSETHQNALFGLLGAIWRLHALEFVSNAGEKNAAAKITNRESLTAVADALGISGNDLEAALTYKTEVVARDPASIPLDAAHSRIQRDELALLLYGWLCDWMVSQINRKYSRPDAAAGRLAIVQLSGWDTAEKSTTASLLGSAGLASNYLAERCLASVYSQVIEAPLQLQRQQQLTQIQTDGIAYEGRGMSILADPAKGLLAKLSLPDMREKPSVGVFSRRAKEVVAAFPGLIKVDGDSHISVRHAWGYDAHYSIEDLLEEEGNGRRLVVEDYIKLFIGSSGVGATAVADAGSRNAVLKAVMTFVARRREKATDAPDSNTFCGTVAALRDVFDRIEDSSIWAVFAFGDATDSAQQIKRLQRALKEPDLQRLGVRLDYVFSVARQSIAALFGESFASGVHDTTTLAGSLGVANSLVAVGPDQWLFTQGAFWRFVKLTGGLYKSEQLQLSLSNSLSGGNAFDDDGASDAGSEMSGYSGISYAPYADPDRASALTATNPAGAALAGVAGEAGKDKGGAAGGTAAAPKKRPTTTARKRWVCCTWCMTWWIPSFALRYCGGMKRKDIQMAWREKLVLNMIVLGSCLAMLFVIIGLGWILCPYTSGKSPGELSNYNSSSDQRVYAYGQWVQVTSLYTKPYHSGIAVSDWNLVLGQDVTGMFQKSWYPSTYCRLMTTADLGFDIYARVLGAAMSNVYYSHSATGNSDAWAAALTTQKTGPVLMGQASYAQLTSDNRYWFIMNDQVYDLTGYVVAGSYPVTLQHSFLGSVFNQKIVIASSGAGTDMTGAYQALLANKSTNAAALAANTCLNNLFKVANVDHREDPQCVVTNWILLGASIIIASAIGFKFIAALQLPSRATPEDFDKFVMVQVPCYTEGPESIAKTVESVAALKYDDKHKLLFVICDGMIIGSGNDRPTPRIVLDVLGVDPAADAPALSYQAVAEGAKQHNMGKIYSGLYSFEGHHIPFITLVKVGTPSEKARPGNRGKRDSQLVVMRFLQKVYFGHEMTPLELELFHQIKNVIGVHPSYYEFVLMIDADTYVLPDSLNKLVAAMIRDSKVIGICGETELANERESWITMIQVYEYFISHYLAKAFESMFNSVTCLPGCFCMYRIRTSGLPGAKTSPLLIAPTIIDAYSDVQVDTLHKKNLLHLGEDRYLTTLLLKTFPMYKTNFTANAQCRTVAPNKWSVLLSQRRRWINSTVHNLFELLLLQDLCGFFCFSLRFVVFLDLFGTITQPAALVYIVYLIVISIVEDNVFPQISIILIACIYGLPILIFIFKRQFEHIGWMLMYILAQPLYGFLMPLYAFWHFDDFSWGNTRLIIGDDGKSKAFVPEEEHFDPSIIPRRRYEDYERELLIKQEAASMEQMQRQQLEQQAVDGTRALDLRRMSQYTMVHPASLGGAYDDGSLEQRFGAQGTASRPASTYSQQGAVPGGSHAAAEFPPSDAELVAAIRSVLSTADLMTVTKRQVRTQISAQYFGGADLSSRKDFINQTIDQILTGAL